MTKDNHKNPDNASESSGMEQPLMSTGTKEPGFNWEKNFCNLNSMKRTEVSLN